MLSPEANDVIDLAFAVRPSLEVDHGAERAPHQSTDVVEPPIRRGP
jgi:hypothetical protein